MENNGLVVFAVIGFVAIVAGGVSLLANVAVADIPNQGPDFEEEHY